VMQKVAQNGASSLGYFIFSKKLRWASKCSPTGKKSPNLVALSVVA